MLFLLHSHIKVISISPVDKFRKGKVVPVHTMMTHEGAEVYFHFLFNHGTILLLTESFKPRLLYPMKEPQHPVTRKLGGLQSQSEHSGEEKISSPCRDLNVC